MLEPECLAQEGRHQGDGTDCSTTLCGACCYWARREETLFRRCIVTSFRECKQGRLADYKLYVHERKDSVGANWAGPDLACAHDPEDAETEGR
ncbi:MAG: hypothetical protein GF346_09270 [Candidatus Eisenbacteria bacterium]|nr:hypothetical protein [Candidatus Latescibacterota bacterium]MBD3302621.1 hypothetical protein [Candidatus Eisenbacteria bacterium]